MKNRKLKKGKIAIMSATMFILTFTLLLTANIPEHSENVTIKRGALNGSSN